MIKVYTSTTCAPCKMTKRWLNENNIAFEEINVNDNEEVAQQLRDRGISSLPFLETTEDTWTGFRVDKLRKLVV